MAYDALGNITSKSDVGSYAYHSTKKHQVTSTSNGWSFGYDGNGNVTNARGATIGWTSYNYAASITNGADSASFSYTPDRQYWRQISNYTSGGNATTIYIGGMLEKVITSAGTDYRHMIHAGNSTVIVSRQTTGTNTTYYALTDHLGSNSTITNSSGAILTTTSYDAFGKRRGGNWTGSPNSVDWSTIAATTRRGYTGHTMLDNLGLVHMNGRVQDPFLGRFMSADPLIDDPSSTQGWNRYSYLKNNPLNATDPSGFCGQTGGDAAWIYDWVYDDDCTYYYTGEEELVAVGLGWAHLPPSGTSQGQSGGSVSLDPELIEAVIIFQDAERAEEEAREAQRRENGIIIEPQTETVVTLDGSTVFADVYYVYYGEVSSTYFIGVFNPATGSYWSADNAITSFYDVDEGALQGRLISGYGSFGARVLDSAVNTLEDARNDLIIMGTAELGGIAVAVAARGGATTLEASEILFSQSSVNGVEEIALSMRANGWVGAPIDVVSVNGRLITVDNTRVAAATMTDTPVQATIHSANELLPASMSGRFVSREGAEAATWGEAISTRIGNQNGLYRELYPEGSWYIGVNP